MWLICLSFLLCLIPLAIVGGLAYGTRKVNQALPPVFEQGQEVMTRVSQGVDKGSETVAEPFIAISARTEQAKETLQHLIRSVRRKI
jgi:hypothetical protein